MNNTMIDILKKIERMNPDDLNKVKLWVELMLENRANSGDFVNNSQVSP